MTKARLVITAVVVEGRTHAQAAADYGASRSWVTRLVARWRLEGDAAFEPRSRRPNTSPGRTDAAVVELICEMRRQLTAAGLDAGPDTIRWHLSRHHGIEVSASTIRRRLVAAGLVVPEPRKRPKSSYVRFQADLPNEMWQADMCHWRLAGGSGAEILSFIDDCSRYALSVSAHRSVGVAAVAEAFRETAAHNGIPASVLTDNAMYFTTRFAGGRGGPNAFETLLGGLGGERSRTLWRQRSILQPFTPGSIPIVLRGMAGEQQGVERIRTRPMNANSRQSNPRALRGEGPGPAHSMMASSRMPRGMA